MKCEMSYQNLRIIRGQLNSSHWNHLIEKAIKNDGTCDCHIVKHNDEWVLSLIPNNRTYRIMSKLSRLWNVLIFILKDGELFVREKNDR